MRIGEKNSKISILIQANVDEDNYNAQNLNAKEIISRLNPDKFDITTFYTKKPDIRLINKNNVRLLKITKIKLLNHLLIFLVMFREDFDIIFYIRNIEGYYYLKLRRFDKKNKKIIHSVESINSPYESKLNLKEENYIIKNSDCVVSISKKVQTELISKLQIESNIIPVGIDYNNFIPRFKDKKTDDIIVIFVGSFQRRKRPNIILDLAKKMPNITFKLIGKGELNKHLVKKIEINNLRNVQISSNISSRDLIKIYQNADIFVFPSLYEGLPKVTLEAAACGLPILVFDNYNPESVLNNISGFIVHSEEELLEKLLLLVNDAKLREKMGLDGREYIKRFDWNIVVQMWEKLFLDCVSEKDMDS